MLSLKRPSCAIKLLHMTCFSTFTLVDRLKLVKIVALGRVTTVSPSSSETLLIRSALGRYRVTHLYDL